ncbi:hypothetical protein [Cereibacter sphaeroides]|jgi:hypothetical protein|uniref:hypothetical protein n=1 Tax=Cereibacter sphaeroides TaxID=1063 RepID=UPI0003197315
MEAIEMQRNNLRARCLALGISPNVRNMRAVRTQMAGCNAGRAIIRGIADGEERVDLFGAVQHMRRVVARYDSAIGAPRRHAVCLRLLVPLDALEASADDPAPDDRTDEEKAVSAVAAYMSLQGWLGFVDARARSEALRVCLDDETVRDPDGLLRALACIVEGLDGRRIQFRGRS